MEWIKVTDRLPDDKYAMYHVVTYTDVYCNTPKNQNIEEFWGGDEGKKKWWQDNVKWWCEIVIPQPPKE